MSMTSFLFKFFWKNMNFSRKSKRGNLHFVKIQQDNCMSKAICSECQYMYDSRFGLPECGISPGESFWTADDSVFICPQCGLSKDMFIEVEDSVTEVEDPLDLMEIEAEHVPVYRISDDTLEVRVWQLGSEHPQDEAHRIEWIEVKDKNNEVIERVYFGPDEEATALFSVDLDEEFEVFALCSEHGIWKWISHESMNL